MSATPSIQITPNLFVETIEAVLPFYERLGFVRTAEVPHGGALGFVILRHGEVELMLQSRASIAEDVPGLEKDAYRTMLYVQVPALAPIRAALAGVPTIVPERTTFYGAREILVRDPAGNVLAFASREA